MRIKLALLMVAAFVFPCASRAADEPGDTKEARIKAAERYLKVASMKAMMEDTAEQMGKSLPPAQAAELKELLTKKLDIKALETAAMDALVKQFTVKEINALADFYGTPEGRSIMKKFGSYMAELQPVIQREVQKAAGK